MNIDISLLPDDFWIVPYNGANYPGAVGVSGLNGGANCQQYAYSILRYFGFVVPDFRSSDLWDDKNYTKKCDVNTPLSLVLLNDNKDSYGSHVGLYLENGEVLHLSKKNNFPKIEKLYDLQKLEEYKYLIGSKKLIDKLK